MTSDGFDQSTMWTIQRGSNWQRDRHSAFSARNVPVASAILHIPACRPHHQPFDAQTADGKTVTLLIEDFKLTWSMEIKYNIKVADGSEVHGFLHNTIHRLRE